MRLTIWAIVFLNFFWMSCENNGSAEPTAQPELSANPAAPGFNADASDEQAIKLADEVVAAMGGRKAWDDTRFIGWNFFGRRHLLWDKKEKLVRIATIDSMLYLVDLENDRGRVFNKGVEYTQPDSISKYVERGKSIWINDSYWLVLPFKLKDSGVTLKYIGQDTTSDGQMAQKLSLTFSEVGRTPQNKYHVYIDDSLKMVTQWDYFPNASDNEPRLSTPWGDYQQQGNIMLSGNRGGNRRLQDIAVYETIPASAFQEPTPLNFADLKKL